MQDKPMPSVKKEWKNPELVLISQNTVATAKTHVNVKEGTGTQSGGSFSTPHHFVWFIGTKYQAILS